MTATAYLTEIERPELLERLRVLHVEDSDNDALIIARMLERETESFSGTRVQTREDMEKALNTGTYDVILCDHDMPCFSALGALEVLKARKLDIPFILVTGAIGGDEAAVELMRKGAADYIPKHKMSRLLPAIRRELRDASMRQAKRDADEALHRKNLELRSTIQSLIQTQDELVRAGRLKSLGKMASSISSDLKEAVSRISHLTGELEESAPEACPAQIAGLREATLSAEKTLKRLGYFFDVQPRDQARAAVDVNLAISDSLENAKSKLEGIGAFPTDCIKLSSNLREVPKVWGDEGHFRDIFTSLFFNACHAMPVGGHLTISSYRITRAVVVEIEDDGIGMSEDTLEHSMESFFSMNPEIGAGFGLAWVNALMEKHGGVMRVTSHENAGTKVHLRFAIYDGDEGASDATTVDLTERPSLRIMLVDDEKSVVDTLAAALEADRHIVKTAANGFEALEMMRGESFDLIISDHAMSECDGEELARRLQQRGGKEKFILATGVGDQMIADCRRIPGVDLILPKPISRDALRKAIVESGVYLTA